MSASDPSPVPFCSKANLLSGLKIVGLPAILALLLLAARERLANLLGVKNPTHQYALIGAVFVVGMVGGYVKK